MGSRGPSEASILHHLHFNTKKHSTPKGKDQALAKSSLNKLLPASIRAIQQSFQTAESFEIEEIVENFILAKNSSPLNFCISSVFIDQSSYIAWATLSCALGGKADYSWVVCLLVGRRDDSRLFSFL